MKEPAINPKFTLSDLAGWAFGLLVAGLGVANLILVHPVPGITYLLFSLLYFPPFTAFIQDKTGIKVPTVLKIVLGVVLIWFTLGVSDLGDMID